MGVEDIGYHEMKKKLFMMDSFIETLLDEVGDAVFYQDMNMVYRFFNEAYLETVNKKAEEVYGQNIFNIFPKEEAEVYYKDDLLVLNSGQRQSYETVLNLPGNSKKIIQVIKRPHINEKGEVVGIFGIIKDITDLRENQKRLMMLDRVKQVFLDINRNILTYKSEHDFFDGMQMEIQSVFDQSKESSVLAVDNHGEISILVHRGYVNEEAGDFRMPLTESYFYKHSGGNFDEAFYVNDINAYMTNTDIPVVTPEADKTVKASLCIPLVVDEQLKYIISIDSSKKDVYNSTDQLVAEFISKELPIIYRIFKLHKETLKLSEYDELSGIYNRRMFNEKATEAIVNLEKKENFVLIILDIDNLKTVNDRYGHLAGDQYIIDLVNEIKLIIHDRINFGRIGGDEFAGFFVGYDYDEVENIMNKLQNDFSKKMIQEGDNSFSGSFSYGMAYYGIDGRKRTDLMKIADLRMYKNKRQKP